MIREELKLSKARLPEAQAEAAWAALDKVSALRVGVCGEVREGAQGVS